MLTSVIQRIGGVFAFSLAIGSGVTRSQTLSFEVRLAEESVRAVRILYEQVQSNPQVNPFDQVVQSLTRQVQTIVREDLSKELLGELAAHGLSPTEPKGVLRLNDFPGAEIAVEFLKSRYLGMAKEEIESVRFVVVTNPQFVKHSWAQFVDIDRFSFQSHGVYELEFKRLGGVKLSQAIQLPIKFEILNDKKILADYLQDIYGSSELIVINGDLISEDLALILRTLVHELTHYLDSKSLVDCWADELVSLDPNFSSAPYQGSAERRLYRWLSSRDEISATMSEVGFMMRMQGLTKPTVETILTRDWFGVDYPFEAPAFTEPLFAFD